MFEAMLDNIAKTGDLELYQMVEEEIRNQWEEERQAAMRYQRSLASANVSRTSKGVDGIGWCEAEIPATVRFYFNQIDPGLWRDKAARAKWLRANPEFRNRYERKPMISLADVPANKVNGELKIFRAGKYARVSEMGGTAA